MRKRNFYDIGRERKMGTHGPYAKIPEDGYNGDAALHENAD
jgi:hypothetical protein